MGNGMPAVPLQLSGLDMRRETRRERNALKWKLSAAFQSGVVCREFELDQDKVEGRLPEDGHGHLIRRSDFGSTLKRDQKGPPHRECGQVWESVVL